mgnify:CR=1 FL=1
MLSPGGLLVALVTIESARRKGYAKLVMKKVCKMLAEDSIEPFTSVSNENIPSLAVMRSIGFSNIYDCDVFHCKKN